MFIKTGKYAIDTNSNAVVVNNTHQHAPNMPAANIDADSGRASMASNIDQDQYSPIFQRMRSLNLVYLLVLLSII